MKQLTLDKERFNEIWESLIILEIDFEPKIKPYIDFIKRVDIEGLQQNWTNKDRSKNSPIWLVDKIGEHSNDLISEIKKLDTDKYRKLTDLTELILRNGNGDLDNKKLIGVSLIIDLTGVKIQELGC